MFFGFISGLLAIPVLLKLAKLFGLYICVGECQSLVYTLFGKVIGTIEKPGLQFPLSYFGPKALLIP
ncbi:MAG TPA: SPFH/Band 7/PHB domain protein, partial [Planctomycetaceae bacterium]|nr:SPFH/Band 7/PHB domain protein [Planctomycetaceae bacterium]